MRLDLHREGTGYREYRAIENGDVRGHAFVEMDALGNIINTEVTSPFGTLDVLRITAMVVAAEVQLMTAWEASQQRLREEGFECIASIIDGGSGSTWQHPEDGRIAEVTVRNGNSITYR